MASWPWSLGDHSDGRQRQDSAAEVSAGLPAPVAPGRESGIPALGCLQGFPESCWLPDVELPLYIGDL